MARRTTLIISPRKQPRQARSARLVAGILEAANRVLVREGARHFTTQPLNYPMRYPARTSMRTDIIARLFTVLLVVSN